MKSESNSVTILPDAIIDKIASLGLTHSRYSKAIKILSLILRNKNREKLKLEDYVAILSTYWVKAAGTRYDLTMKIRDNLTPENRKRVFVYEGTEEKRQMLDMMKATKGKIIMGPSILEGLDLKDEFSRFQIFAKVPYLSLNDRFVKTKMTINPGWYRWKAIINILQGTGRSVRNEDDWAITYILDGSLGDLIHNNRRSFPAEFLRRIVVVNE